MTGMASDAVSPQPTLGDLELQRAGWHWTWDLPARLQQAAKEFGDRDSVGTWFVQEVPIERGCKWIYNHTNKGDAAMCIAPEVMSHEARHQARQVRHQALRAGLNQSSLLGEGGGLA